MQINVVKRLTKLYEELLRTTSTVCPSRKFFTAYLGIATTCKRINKFRICLFYFSGCVASVFSAFDFTRVIFFLVLGFLSVLCFPSFKIVAFYGFLPSQRTNAFMGILLFYFHLTIICQPKKNKPCQNIIEPLINEQYICH